MVLLGRKEESSFPPLLVLVLPLVLSREGAWGRRGLERNDALRMRGSGEVFAGRFAELAVPLRGVERLLGRGRERWGRKE